MKYPRKFHPGGIEYTIRPDKKSGGGGGGKIYHDTGRRESRRSVANRTIEESVNNGGIPRNSPHVPQSGWSQSGGCSSSSVVWRSLTLPSKFGKGVRHRWHRRVVRLQLWLQSNQVAEFNALYWNVVNLRAL